MAALIIVLATMPEPTALATYAQHRAVMGKVAEWLLLPSLTHVDAGLLAGLLNSPLRRPDVQHRSFISLPARVAKLFIIDAARDDRIPFLRGVMVESLVRIGLTFQDAYLLAQQVREGFENETEITKAALRKRVSGELRRNFSASLARAYDLGSSQERQIMVRSADDEAPFSVGLLSRSLQACAIDRADALETARKVQEYLRNADTAAIDLAALRKIIFDRLEAHCSRAAAERFISWQGFRDSALPLIVLVGGITGTGKSTLTTELAYRLNIVRTQSTDMMREIVRCYLPSKKSPTLGFSSFEAWRGLTKDSEPASKAAQADMVRGFMSQFELVKHGLQATIARAVKEAHD